jgi:hypothetical protein
MASKCWHKIASGDRGLLFDAAGVILLGLGGIFSIGSAAREKSPAGRRATSGASQLATAVLED